MTNNSFCDLERALNCRKTNLKTVLAVSSLNTSTSELMREKRERD